MTRNIALTLLLITAFGSTHAAEFTGEFEGFDTGGRLLVSGKAYPLKPDVQAIYGSKLVAIEQLPVGTEVSFELGQHSGVSSVLRLQVTGHNEQLDGVVQDY